MTSIDRFTTIVVTALVTSACWFVVGQGLFSPAQQERPDEPQKSESVGAGDRSLVPSAKPRPLETAIAAKPGLLTIPVSGVSASQLVDTFSDQRGGGARLHEAIDIMAPRGTPVISASAGTVEKLYTSDAGGLTAYVRSADRKEIYYYAHLDDYAEGLKEGGKLEAGQRIGSVGSSGNASPDAPHLHFAILETTEDADWWEPSNAINPFARLGGKPKSAQ